MIKSISFPLDGNGYIYSKPEKPEKPVKMGREFTTYDSKTHAMVFNEKKYNEAMEVYKEEMKIWRKTKNDFILPCAHNLVGKTFSFEDGKINILFGPNASGKTTILKAIAGKCLITDGFTKLLEPMEMRGVSFGENATVDSIKENADRMAANTSTLDWTGNLVYYDNFASRRTGFIGDLVGSFIENVGEEISYIIGKNSSSAGQHTAYVFNKIAKVATKQRSLKEVVEGQKWGNRMNDTWTAAYESQVEYFSALPDYDKDLPTTILLDEIDKSLDIETVWKLYTEVLPAFVEKKNCQFIMVSHSPLILSDDIYKSDKYNIISLDEDYTKAAKEILKKAHF